MNQERMDMEYPKINIFELLRGLFKSAVRMLIPGILLVALISGLLCVRAWRGYVPMYQASASFTVIFFIWQPAVAALPPPPRGSRIICTLAEPMLRAEI